ncbi:MULTISPECIES: efflux RND transporter permease subunit [unclassified Flavobacterium]|uniref:efflux RND transporter permease subunit n=1 Tax=unclassified Flavobacterium TaxID=196869 RepID=UPI00070CC7FF|nr:MULTISPECIES: efflux RND transporter permease subunit [unclassified Flavobacterium]KRD61104.1 multidrug transporter AcrB [Flavobacterium sp. Root935]MDQ1166197.1 HAE1 family hydrophobic/amphiphilic exporter-1 [Flavobacterium sp. SORGH_AS_0622]BDU26743.1 multidrug transporter AcrB [Flavobacterium sp. GSB-24]
MFKKFIQRPVLSTVISVIIVILGVLGLIELPISQYPDIAPPTVNVAASYTGANADVVLKSIVIPLEEQINGVENMTYMTSTATNDGNASIKIFFKVGTNPDLAAVNVQNRVSRATSLLPVEVTQAGVTVTKSQSSNLLIFSLYSDDKAYDQTFLQNYAKINLVPQIQRVVGVGDVTVFGAKDYSMRIWLKPDVMQQYKLIPSDISAALAEQNIEAAPGKFGENGNQAFQYVIKYKGRLTSAQEFEDIIIKSVGNGQMLRLKDVAKVELGSLSYSSTIKTNGVESAAMAISQTPGSNARDVIINSKKLIEEAAKSFPKGMKYTIMVDVNENLDASIEKVIHTLIEAFILVFIVVFIFLQDFRSTLIPAIAVPVAIVGTFFFLNLFGFTINLLTLFAMVLAIGIVVDDAIVVVEAVHAKLDHGYKSAKKATIHAMDEISGAIISITLVMAAVFIPVTFITGSTGVFYKQFGITLAVAIILSAVNALTLSPALCALLLKPHADDHKHKSYLQRFYTSFNVAFDNVTQRYKRSVSFLSVKKWIVLASILIAGLGLFYMMKTTPSAFVPSEDQGTVFANISLPPSASMERSDIMAKKVDSIAKTIPGVKNTLRIVGQNFTAGAGSAYSMVIVKLYPWDQRDLSVDDVIGQLFAKTSGIREASIFFISPPTIQGFGQSGGFEFQLQDKGGHTTSEFYKVNNEFLAKLAERPEIQYATTPFNPGFPQYMMDINLAKAKDAGVSVNTILSTMQGYYGGLYASNFNKFGKQYRVMVQASPEFRANTQGLNKIFVRNSAGTMAPITEFVKMTRVFGPESISRFNLFTSISITGAPKPGYSSGDAIKAIQEVAAENLPAGYGYEFSGLTREELASGSETIFIFILCLVFVYFLLSAQYESYILPFAVLFSIPFGLAGAYLFSIIFKLNSNIYLQISLIMLIGLLAKNGILIVEFALDRRRKGLPIVQAAIEGAVARLRPILMTSFAFILGLVPLMFASGAGAVGNKSIGTGAVGGMLIGTILGVFVIPVLFIIFQTLQERISGPAKDGYDDDDDDEEIHLLEAHKE